MVTLTGVTMGTTYTIRAIPTQKSPAIAAHGSAARQKGTPLAALQPAVDQLLATLTRQLSTYDPESEISRFNASRSTDWFPVSAGTAQLVSEAQRFSDFSHGAFDITVLPLVNLWSFGPEPRRDVVPAEQEIAERRQLVDYRRLEVRAVPAALRKSDSRMAVDLSAIAKGYAVDQVGQLLAARGMASYMVEIGGEVRTRGRRSEGTPWRIGIEQPPLPRPRSQQGSFQRGPSQQNPLQQNPLQQNPLQQNPLQQNPLQLGQFPQGTLNSVLELGRNESLATSGDYRNYFEREGRRYSHTIDPRTGSPITHTLASVTVVHSECAAADAYATAAMVLGPENGYDWLVAQELPALLLIRSGSQFVSKATPRFQAAYQNGVGRSRE